MSVLGTNHQCVLGGKTSKEWTAKNKKNNWSCSSTGNGFICQNCNRFSCHTCAKKLLNLVKKEAKGYIEPNSFCTEIEKAIQNNVQPTKCHSCWMDKTEIDRTFKNTIASGRGLGLGVRANVANDHFLFVSLYVLKTRDSRHINDDVLMHHLSL